MFAGVSHDLRTVLMHLKLELALIDDSPEVDAMEKGRRRNGAYAGSYLAFARGDSGETSAPIDMARSSWKSYGWMRNVMGCRCRRTCLCFAKCSQRSGDWCAST